MAVFTKSLGNYESKKEGECFEELDEVPETFGDLQELVYLKTKEYLMLDNPAENANKFLANKENRENAISYFTNIIQQNRGESLLAELLYDILGKGKRTTDKQYRKRLMEGICEYFGLNKAVIENKALAIVHKELTYTLREQEYSLTNKKIEALITIIMHEHIKKKTAHLEPYLEPNLPFKSIQSNKL